MNRIFGLFAPIGEMIAAIANDKHAGGEAFIRA
jgi:hypothetical protein